MFVEYEYGKWGRSEAAILHNTVVTVFTRDRLVGVFAPVTAGLKLSRAVRFTEHPPLVSLDRGSAGAEGMMEWQDEFNLSRGAARRRELQSCLAFGNF